LTTLRPAGADDVDRLVAWHADPEVSRYWDDETFTRAEMEERLARNGETVDYEVASEAGPPHDRRFEIRATVAGNELGVGSGRSKKEAEQAAARLALERLRG